MTRETKKVAILIEQDVEDSEFQIPNNALRAAGAEVSVLGSRLNHTYTGKKGKVSVEADGTTTEASVDDFDAVVIPGGVAPDKMRTNMKTVRFVGASVNSGKLVAAICHGPQVLIEADVLRGRRATGFRAIRKDMQNAGAQFENVPLMIDGSLITSRRPADLAIFTAAILRHLSLSAKDVKIPEINDLTVEWWQLAEEWGGQAKDEIIQGINTAIANERYALRTFEQYAEKAGDPQLKGLFSQVVTSKQSHISMLEGRLATLGGKEDLMATGSGALGTFKSWLQSSDEISLLRRALIDLQMGVVDTFSLTNQFTDPVTAALFDQIEIDLARYEQRAADLFHERVEQKTKGASSN